MNYINIPEQMISIDAMVLQGRNYEKAIDFLHPLFKRLNFEVTKVFIPPEHAGAVAGHIILPSAPVISAIGSSRNISSCDECLGPPPQFENSIESNLSIFLIIIHPPDSGRNS